MKILWVKTDYLHPTDRGGQIRTLEMLKRLHARHEVHYLTLADPANAEGPARAHEYCARHFAVPHFTVPRSSWRFYAQALAACFHSLPLAIGRWTNEAMRLRARELQSQENYDAVVCDFLVPAASLENWPKLVLFQHNVEALIWQRHAEMASSFPQRWYFRSQFRKMHEFERRASREFGRVICVSEADAALTQSRYGRPDVHWVPTGVDTAYFAPPALAPGQAHDLIFLGSMDWMPNVDGAHWLAAEILPAIWRSRPQTTAAFVGRRPVEAIRALASDPRITVSGTVDDVRPWLHASKLSIVPLRIGGGTRLKIYEAMAAGVATVSTSVGAEGLEVASGSNILLADAAPDFAAACLDLLNLPGRRASIAAQALQDVRARHGWEAVTRRFESYLNHTAKA